MNIFRSILLYVKCKTKINKFLEKKHRKIFLISSVDNDFLGQNNSNTIKNGNVYSINILKI